MCLKYCGGSARLAETIFGWGRNNVELGLAEKRTGITCIGAQAAFRGNKSWKERYPEAAASLRVIASADAQPDPSFLTTLAYTRLTAAEAIKQLQQQGYPDEQVPARAHNGANLKSNRLPIETSSQSQASKKIPQTDAIFDNIQAKDRQADNNSVKRLSIDCKATLNMGDFSRRSQTRGDNREARS
jgi:hypothetical protein